MQESSLPILKQLARGMAAQFGNDCEIVIHDLCARNIDKSIVHIENGHVTGRQSGGGPSPVVLDAIKHHAKDTRDKLAYLIRTDNGRILKCSTLFIKDQSGNPRYVFAINYDITNLVTLESSLQTFTSCQKSGGEDDRPKTIPHDVNELLDELIQQSVDLVGVPAALMSKDDKIKAINYLNEAGAFLITRSGDKVSKFFGISKYTLYTYVDINKS